MRKVGKPVSCQNSRRQHDFLKSSSQSGSETERGTIGPGDDLMRYRNAAICDHHLLPGAVTNTF
jgi:hypothetical protein